MATLNKTSKVIITTHEGAKACSINAEQQLRRSVLATLLWEDGAYESGKEVAERIRDLIKQVSPEKVASIAVECREKQKLRHVPLYIVREMARLPNHKRLVASTLEKVIQRPDELTEFLAIYWKDGRQPVSAQVKKGLAAAFKKFNEYSLAKFNKDGKVKLRDVLFLCHAKPEQTGSSRTIVRKYADGNTKELTRHTDSVFTKLTDDTLETPDTWEVALSGGADKKETFTRLMNDEKLGALAFVRNLRNMKESGVDPKLVERYADTVNADKVLPFRFISAARAVPQWEPFIERMMLRCTEKLDKLTGKTVIVVDTSGSMVGTKVSAKSEIDRLDAACALAILIREISDSPVVVAFSGQATVVPSRRGFALSDAIKKSPGAGGGTNTDTALDVAEKEGYDRIIVITDEQSAQSIRKPIKGSKAYFINVANCKNGIVYGDWVHIDGCSESIVEYIREYEKLNSTGADYPQ